MPRPPPCFGAGKGGESGSLDGSGCYGSRIRPANESGCLAAGRAQHGVISAVQLMRSATRGRRSGIGSKHVVAFTSFFRRLRGRASGGQPARPLDGGRAGLRRGRRAQPPQRGRTVGYLARTARDRPRGIPTRSPAAQGSVASECTAAFDLPPAELTRHRSIPVTSPALTIVDIAPRLSEPQLETAINEADKSRLDRSRCDCANASMTCRGFRGSRSSVAALTATPSSSPTPSWNGASSAWSAPQTCRCR